MTVSRSTPNVSRKGPPPNRRGASTRAHIIATAGTIFGNQGFYGTSIREIAAAAEVTHPTLLHHFPSKEVLLSAVLHAREEQSSSFVTDGEPDLRGFYDRLTRHNQNDPGLIALFTQTAVDSTNINHPTHDQFSQRYKAIVGRLTEILQDAKQRGSLKPGVDPLRAAQTLVAIQDGAQIQWLYDPSSVDIPALMSHALDTMLTD